VERGVGDAAGGRNIVDGREIASMGEVVVELFEQALD
jgi:hypothetical protein